MKYFLAPVFFFLIYLDVLLMGLVDFLLVAEFLLSPKPMHVWYKQKILKYKQVFVNIKLMSMK